MQSTPCKIRGHSNNSIVSVCISLKCKNTDKLSCGECLMDFHKDHMNECIKLAEFRERVNNVQKQKYLELNELNL
jgi:hypothetical protein